MSERQNPENFEFPKETVLSLEQRCLAPLDLVASYANLGPEGPHIWMLSLGDLLDRDVSSMLPLLHNLEQQRYRSYRSLHARWLYLLKRVLVRGVLSQYADVAPEAWFFERGTQGRPYVAEPSKPVHFNLASSGELAVCLVSSQPQCGIDLEDQERPGVLEVANLLLSSAERMEFHHLEDRDRTFTLLQLWTLKEAYVKAIGLGLAVPLTSITFHKSAEVRSPSFDQDLEKRVRWKFSRGMIFNRYLFAVATCCAHSPPVEGV